MIVLTATAGISKAITPGALRAMFIIVQHYDANKQQTDAWHQVNDWNPTSQSTQSTAHGCYWLITAPLFAGYKSMALDYPVCETMKMPWEFLCRLLSPAIIKPWMTVVSQWLEPILNKLLLNSLHRHYWSQVSTWSVTIVTIIILFAVILYESPLNRHY